MPQSEQTALLPPASDAALSHSQGTSRQRRVIILLLFYVVFLDIGYELIVPAQTRVFEQIYCRLYYEKHNPSLIGDHRNGQIDEKLCKNDVIQGEVAMLKGWQLALDGIGMLAFSVPWAYVADFRGRKPVLLLLTCALLVKYAFVQLICLFDGAVALEWSWLSAFHTVLGGSVTVATALIYTVVSDVVPEDKRISVFFRVQAAAIITQFLGPLLSAGLMIRSPWYPMVLGLVVELISILILYFLPETLELRGPVSTAPPSPSSADTILEQSPPRHVKLLRAISSSIAILTSDKRVLVAASSFVVHMLFLHRDILLQYISTRYNTSLSRATVIISVRSGLIVLFALFILPRFNTFYRKRLGSSRADLILCRISAVFLAGSFLGIALSPTLGALVLFLTLNSLGWGLFSFLRSLMTSLVHQDEVARLNSIIGVFDTAGQMLGSPILASLFWKGVKLQGFWFGLPFFFYTLVLSIIILSLLQAHV
ncbi:major facilitator superfamily domain-containing protein [Fusarium flagelliforme]|uniref:major facilitator superfamily domain-containing protein n=1 Tax=Fusarium flagelliforme TaxID=2675880 RepID=UPI001E8D006A|nr:major facilitator superfamily domain-containing protein [Fusarium flagelliforme]KAH7182277.1 major facilitator superfamily domain-containing protein [Fusarium flagelliforme]